MTTNRTAVLCDLHALLHRRLFEHEPWLAEDKGEVQQAILRKFEKLGLEERVEEDDTWWHVQTDLGAELDSELMKVFAGVWFDGEMPLILEEHGLISEDEQADIFERFWGRESSEKILRPIVRRAFYQYFGKNSSRLT